MPNFTRKRLAHGVPNWIDDGATYFITMNCRQRGCETLIVDATAQAIKQAIQNYTDQGKWWPQLFVLMPDHLHALCSLNTASYGIRQIISPWKGYLHKSQNIEWQEGFFEHRIRSQDALVEKAQYMRLNPVRAGLTDRPESWPYLWSTEDFQK